jgi:hypothetical protein
MRRLTGMISSDTPSSTSKRVAVRAMQSEKRSSRTWLAGLILVAGVFLHRSYLASGDMNWGDWFWVSPSTLDDYMRLPNMWDPMWNMGMTNAQVNIGPVYSMMGVLGSLGLSASMAQRILVFWPMAILPLVSMYWMLGRFGLRPGARAAGAFLFAGNTYMATRGIQHPFLVLGAATAPLVWTATLDAIEMARKTALNRRSLAAKTMLFGGFFSLSVMFDVRMAMLAIVPVLALVAIALVKTPRSRIPLAAFFVGGMGVTVLLHAFWIIPTVLGGGGAGFDGKLPEAPFLNFYDLPHALALSEPYYTGEEPVWFSNNAVMLPLLALPFLAFGGVVVARRRTTPAIAVFALMACVGVALLKGQNEPAGFLYNVAFDYVPGMQFFRDSAKFAVWVAAGYAVLVAICLNRAANWWSGRDDDGAAFPEAARQLRLFSDARSTAGDILRANSLRILAVVVVGSFLVASVYSSRGSITNELGGTSRLLKPGPDYAQMEDIVSSDRDFGRVLWFPYISRWPVISELHPPMNPAGLRPSAEFVQGGRPLAADPVLVRDLGLMPNFADAMRMGGAKYAVVDRNIYSQKWEDTGMSVENRATYVAELTGALQANPAFELVLAGSELSAYRLKSGAAQFTAGASADATGLLSSSPAVVQKTGQARFDVRFAPSPEQRAAVVRMSAAFDLGWKAEFRATMTDGSTQTLAARHVSFPDKTNGWIIDALPAGVSEVRSTVHYGPQSLVPLGVVISLLTLTVMAVSAVIIRRRNDDRTVETNDLPVESVIDLNDEREPVLSGR